MLLGLGMAGLVSQLLLEASLPGGMVSIPVHPPVPSSLKLILRKDARLTPFS